MDVLRPVARPINPTGIQNVSMDATTTTNRLSPQVNVIVTL
ncbi:MAG TPA: hypothetical protein VGN07_16265 [Steroidobacteraceae bacterium]